MLGTAPRAQVWIAIEQPGPYGTEALTDSRFPSPIGEQLLKAVESLPIKVLLVRPAGPLALRRNRQNQQPPDGRKVWVARATPGRSAMVSTTITDPGRLLALDLDALLEADLADVVPQATTERERGDPLFVFSG